MPCETKGEVKYARLTAPSAAIFISCWLHSPQLSLHAALSRFRYYDPTTNLPSRRLIIAHHRLHSRPSPLYKIPHAPAFHFQHDDHFHGATKVPLQARPARGRGGWLFWWSGKFLAPRSFRPAQLTNARSASQESTRRPRPLSRVVCSPSCATSWDTRSTTMIRYTPTKSSCPPPIPMCAG